MKSSFISMTVAVAVIFSALAFSPCAIAAGGPGSSAPPAAAATPPAAVASLRQAYATLAVADHDYKGHRVKAMKAIEAACKLLGTDISGDGKVKEKQAISDAQLRAALATVQQVSTAIPAGKGQKQIVNHLNTAVKELTTALTIK